MKSHSSSIKPSLQTSELDKIKAANKQAALESPIPGYGGGSATSDSPQFASDEEEEAALDAELEALGVDPKGL